MYNSFLLLTKFVSRYKELNLLLADIMIIYVELILFFEQRSKNYVFIKHKNIVYKIFRFYLRKLYTIISENPLTFILCFTKYLMIQFNDVLYNLL